MLVQVVNEQSAKITISIPAYLLDLVDALAKEKNTNRSAVIAEILGQIAQERFEAEMREAYTSNSNKELAEEFFPLAEETWPDY